MKFKHFINESEYKEFVREETKKDAIVGLEFLRDYLDRKYFKKVQEILKKAGLPEDLKKLLNKKIPSVYEPDIKTPEDVDVFNTSRTLNWLGWAESMAWKKSRFNMDSDMREVYFFRTKIEDSVDSMLKSFDEFEKLREKLYDKLIYGSE